MDNLNKIGSSRLRDSVDANFRASLVAERFLVATGQKTGGLTTFMNDIAIIGLFFNMLYHILMAIIMVIVVAIAFIIHVIRGYSKKNVKTEQSKESVKQTSTFKDTTPEEDDEMYDLI